MFVHCVGRPLERNWCWCCHWRFPAASIWTQVCCQVSSFRRLPAGEFGLSTYWSCCNIQPHTMPQSSSDSQQLPGEPTSDRYPGPEQILGKYRSTSSDRRRSVQSLCSISSLTYRMCAFSGQPRCGTWIFGGCKKWLCGGSWTLLRQNQRCAAVPRRFD